ncbi:MAG: alpha/beta hydrolase [Geodermatophilaceae bacterium]|nr:alpha/beta hydrolase [Geodermatophilaceae bacterium]
MLSVDVAGLRIAYRRSGHGEPLLLLHGAFSDSREWRRQLDGLSDSLDVIAVDCPGCGGSDDAPEGFTIQDFADCLAGFLRALDVGHPYVGGLSFGSLYALALYRHHPAIPRRLILASAYAGWAGSLPPHEVARRKRWVYEILDRPVEEWGADFLATVYRDPTPTDVQAEAMDILRDVRPEGFRPAAEAFLDADLRDVLPLISVPTLLLYGERDERSPLHVANDLHAQIGGSRLVVVPGTGHGINVEAPEEFNAAVREFLSGL